MPFSDLSRNSYQKQSNCFLFLDHGGLAYTSAFCFESMINHLKKKAFGTKNLGSQIMYWCDIDSIVSTTEYELPSPSLVNEIELDSDLFNEYLDLFTKKLVDLQQDLNKIKLHLRFKDNFSAYHSFLYSKHFSCASYLVSYTDNNEQINYGKIILFYSYENVFYPFIQQYQHASVKLSDYLDISGELKGTVDLFYPVCILSGDFVVVPVSKIISKCVSVQFKNCECISQLRVSYEHD